MDKFIHKQDWMPKAKYGEYGRKFMKYLETKLNDYAYYSYISYVEGRPVVRLGHLNVPEEENMSWGYIYISDLNKRP